MMLIMESIYNFQISKQKENDIDYGIKKEEENDIDYGIKIPKQKGNDIDYGIKIPKGKGKRKGKFSTKPRVKMYFKRLF